MPVSKKRKKDGKPVHRAQAPGEHEAEQPHAHEGPVPGQPPRAGGKPRNPFVAQQQMKRGAQRGR